MAGRRSWKKIVDAMSPDRRARIEQGVQEDIAGMLLALVKEDVLMTLKGREIIASLAEAMAVERAGIPVQSRFIVRTIEAPPRTSVLHQDLDHLPGRTNQRAQNRPKRKAGGEVDSHSINSPPATPPA